MNTEKLCDVDECNGHDDPIISKTKKVMEEEMYNLTEEKCISKICFHCEKQIRQSMIRVLETAMEEISGELIVWACPVCKKVDFKSEIEQSARPEHISYRGIDIGSCTGNMIPLYSLSNIRIQSILNSVKE